MRLSLRVSVSHPSVRRGIMLMQTGSISCMVLEFSLTVRKERQKGRHSSAKRKQNEGKINQSEGTTKTKRGQSKIETEVKPRNAKTGWVWYGPKNPTRPGPADSLLDSFILLLKGS